MNFGETATALRQSGVGSAAGAVGRPTTGTALVAGQIARPSGEAVGFATGRFRRAVLDAMGPPAPSPPQAAIGGTLDPAWFRGELVNQVVPQAGLVAAPMTRDLLIANREMLVVDASMQAATSAGVVLLASRSQPMPPSLAEPSVPVAAISHQAPQATDDDPSEPPNWDVAVPLVFPMLLPEAISAAPGGLQGEKRKQSGSENAQGPAAATDQNAIAASAIAVPAMAVPEPGAMVLPRDTATSDKVDQPNPVPGHFLDSALKSHPRPAFGLKTRDRAAEAGMAAAGTPIAPGNGHSNAAAPPAAGIVPPIVANPARQTGTVAAPATTAGTPAKSNADVLAFARAGLVATSPAASASAPPTQRAIATAAAMPSSASVPVEPSANPSAAVATDHSGAPVPPEPTALTASPAVLPADPRGGADAVAGRADTGIPGPPVAAAPTAGPGASPPAQPASPAASVSQLFVHPAQLARDVGRIVARQLAAGGDGLLIRLDPEQLGRIDIRMSFNEAGNLRAVMGAETSQVLDLLRRDSADLGRAMADAGVSADSQSFRFEGRGGDSRQDRPQLQQRPTTAAGDDLPPDTREADRLRRESQLPADQPPRTF